MSVFIYSEMMMYGICYPIHRPSTTKSTPLPVMCGALVVSCMRYGVSDINHLKDTQTRIA